MSTQGVYSPASLRVLGLTGELAPVDAVTAALLLAARPYPTADDLQRLGELVASSVSWERLLQLAVQHAVIGLVTRNLRAARVWTQLPLEVAQYLESWTRAARTVHFSVAHQLTRLLSACAAADVDPVLLKGAAIAREYPDPAVRSMSDVDILIFPNERERTVRALEHIGYSQQPVYYSAEFNASHGYHFVFRNERDRLLPVELHWELASRLERRNRLTAAMLRRRTTVEPVIQLPKLAAYPVQVLSPAAQLVYLASHAATEGHAFSRLVWLTDIAALVHRRAPLDWTEVTTFARHARSRTATYVALALAQHLLGASVEPNVLHTLRPPSLVLALLERELRPDRYLAPLTPLRRTSVKYLVVDNPATTARLIAERIVPPPIALGVYDQPSALLGLPGSYTRYMAKMSSMGFRKVFTR